MRQSPLSLFHPLLQNWFRQQMGPPTEIQAKAWPVIATGKHVLITAPTGSGKTLTAFLWPLNQLFTGKWTAGQVRVLYVSPLKALNNDVQRNLLNPLKALMAAFQDAGHNFPRVTVMTRSGDTPESERRKIVQHPPEILITTPESLNLMISAQRTRSLFAGLITVILDEVHAISGSKRGVHLISAVERLVLLSGEFQRIALSATINPLRQTADWVGGYQLTRGLYAKRPVSLIASSDSHALAIDIRFPAETEPEGSQKTLWPGLVSDLKQIIAQNQSTLIFVNSRRLAEKITRLINAEESLDLAYSHHGSLSKEIRLTVERKLKNGELKAIVATSSLELGIDIGSLNQILLVQTPFSIAGAIQRIGRSGHAVGLKSHGILFATHGMDLLYAAALAKSVLAKDIEPLVPIKGPLDVLAQIILAMTGVQTWDVDDLFAFIRTMAPYHDLPKEHYDLLLNMLSGHFAGTKLRELRPRIVFDKLDRTIRARKGTMLLVYMAGGTIPDRGYYQLRLSDTKAVIGELDEEFVWERRIGEAFAMGPRVWRIERITHNDVEVSGMAEKKGMFPFWRADSMDRSFYFAAKIGEFLENANAKLAGSKEAFKKDLKTHYFMTRPAANALIDFLTLQKERTQSDLPHRHHLLIEHYKDPYNTTDTKQVILHTFWGGRLNRPFAMALSAAWESVYHYPLEVFAENDNIVLHLPHRFAASDLFSLVDANNVEAYLRVGLEKTGFFGARFRENAGRALLLPRAGFKKRMPLWLNRLRSKKLFEAVKSYPDFPILLETWRACLNDAFDLMHLKEVLDEIETGKIRISETITSHPSPFAGHLMFQQTNTYMYMDDASRSGDPSALREDLIQEVIDGGHGQPEISASLLRTLEAKLQRLAPGYAPDTPIDLVEWIKERLWIPASEWRALEEAILRDHDLSMAELLVDYAQKVVWLEWNDHDDGGICAVEVIPRLIGGFERAYADFRCRRIKGAGPSAFDASFDRQIKTVCQAFCRSCASTANDDDMTLRQAFLIQWLAYYGPFQADWFRNIYPPGSDCSDEDLAWLMEQKHLVLLEAFSKEGQRLYCDRNNYAIVLRLARKARQPELHPRKATELQYFIADYQGVTHPGQCVADLQNRLEQLFGFPAPAQAWEEYILPTRLNPYLPSWLDGLMQSSELTWIGCGRPKLFFTFASDLDLFRDDTENETNEDMSAIIPDNRGRFGFFEIAEHAGLGFEKTAQILWHQAFAGDVTNDTFAVVREGIQNRFTPAPVAAQVPGGRKRRSQFNRWKSSRPLTGNWYVPFSENQRPQAGIPQEVDRIDALERQKDRIRQLFNRYGILFRALIARELKPLTWSKLFRSLRLMELSGEIVSGYFFEGIRGFQFIAPGALRRFLELKEADAIYWINAADPASLCGVQHIELDLPSRLPTTHIVFQGAKKVVVSRRNGKELDIRVSADHPHILTLLDFLKVLITREFNPLKSVTIETINGEAASKSVFKEALVALGCRGEDGRSLVLRRRY